MIGALVIVGIGILTLVLGFVLNYRWVEPDIVKVMLPVGFLILLTGVTLCILYRLGVIV